MVAALDEEAPDEIDLLSVDARTPGSAATPKPITAADWALMEDAPTTGRLLNALGRHRHAPRPLSDDSVFPHFIAGGTVRFGRLVRTTVDHRCPQSLDPSSSPELAAMQHFLMQACKALPERQPSLITRLSERIKGGVTESAWRTGPGIVDVRLRHGTQTWYVAFKFHREAVQVQVANERVTVIECEVAKTQPANLSQNLPHALDGDVRSTELALDAVQRAMAAEARALH